MKIYITGISGTGKTSLARALTQKGVNAIDMDEISHWENTTTHEKVELMHGADNQWLENNAWVCDVSKLKEMISNTENAVALGHASNQDEYLSLFDKTYVLKCSPETIIGRINARTDNDYGKHPEDLARILEWNKGFNTWMTEKGAIILDAERPIDLTLNDVVSNFSKT